VLVLHDELVHPPGHFVLHALPVLEAAGDVPVFVTQVEVVNVGVVYVAVGVTPVVVEVTLVLIDSE